MKHFVLRRLFLLGALGSLSASGPHHTIETVHFFQPDELSVCLESYHFDFRQNCAVIAGYPGSSEQINAVKVYRMANDNEPNAELKNVLSAGVQLQQRWTLLCAINNPVPEVPCHFYVNGSHATASSGFAIDLTQPESLSLRQELEARYAPGNRLWELPDPDSPARPSRTSLGGCCNIQ